MAFGLHSAADALVATVTPADTQRGVWAARAFHAMHVLPQVHSAPDCFHRRLTRGYTQAIWAWLGAMLGAKPHASQGSQLGRPHEPWWALLIWTVRTVRPLSVLQAALRTKLGSGLGDTLTLDEDQSYALVSRTDGKMLAEAHAIVE